MPQLIETAQWKEGHDQQTLKSGHSHQKTHDLNFDPCGVMGFLSRFHYQRVVNELQFMYDAPVFPRSKDDYSALNESFRE
jgi:hypothetical protein